MRERELQDYLKTNFPHENEKCEWKEFKNLKHSVSGREGEDIISYISAIANMEGGYLIIGVEDKTLKIIGIQDFLNHTITNIKLNILKDCPNLSSEGFAIQEFTTEDTDKIIWIFHIPKHTQRLPVYAHKKMWQRINDSLVPMTSARLKTILEEVIITDDWSAAILPDAILDDLEPKAIEYAKQKFLVKFPELKNDVEIWNDITFLNKAKITIKGKITRTAIILLGRSESENYLIPSITKMRWILKNLNNEEKDYDIFPPPFILAIDKIYDKIRNLKYRYLPKGTLFPNELLRYEPFNIREAINNCVAHNDYTKGGYINIVEFEDDRLIFSNKGYFIPGSIEKVILQDAPEENYRNLFLANAMFQLGLVDTRGGGIKKMYVNQIKRFFPLPDYEFEDGRTQMTLTGKILDEEFVEILSHHPELSLDEVVLLDRVQKKKDISDEGFKHLKRLKFIEGRKPNFFLSEKVIKPLNDPTLKAEYIKNRGIDDQFLKKYIIDYLKLGKASRKNIDRFIWEKISAMLDDDKKRNKIKNLLQELRKEEKIISKEKGKWEII